MPVAAPNVSTTYGQLLTRDEILRLSWQTAGLLSYTQEARPDQLAIAFKYMDLELDVLQAEHIIEQSVDFETLELEADTAAYELDETIFDVLGSIIIIGTDNTETTCEPMNAEEWTTSQNQGAVSSRPTRCYVKKTQPIVLNFLPAPDSDFTARYRRVRLLPDVGSGGNTIPLLRYFHMYLMYAVAAHLARANSLPSVADGLKVHADAYKGLALRSNRYRGPLQIHVTQRGPWR